VDHNRSSNALHLKKLSSGAEGAQKNIHAKKRMVTKYHIRQAALGDTSSSSEKAASSSSFRAWGLPRSGDKGIGLL
jgi:hypothetical protein